jgi:hypothetical protein
MSIRELARRLQIAPSHLSRVIRHADAKRVSGSLARRVATALGLPPEHFAEARIATILDGVSSDAELRDAVYRQVRKGVDS